MSVHEIGQRLCDKFDDGEDRVPRVFIAGDACHTHIRTTFDLDWKWASVLQERAAPRLLATYSDKRQPIAKS